MTTHFDTLTALRDEWQALQPLQADREGRLWQKLRLEWNYHSNHIEGNTLTYGETELLLLHDLTTHNHTLREYLEMKAHDVGIGHVRELASDPGHVLTEADIRDLNKIILKEPFWKAAQTADGQSSRIWVIPGQYKATPNNVRTITGEMFYFASVEDTAPKMQDLAAWIRQELATPTLHPAALAAKLHYDFVRIHPFDDGNGRVARLLTNYVLLRTGYLPIIVRTDDKAGYLAALRQGDVGDLAPFTEYMAKLAEWSLQLGVRAAKGESIEELTDVEKELAIFIRNQAGHVNEVAPLSPQVLQELVEISIRRLMAIFNAKLKKLDPLFSRHSIFWTPSEEMSIEELFKYIISSPHLYKQLGIQHSFSGFRGKASDPLFRVDINLEIQFEEFRYKILVGEQLISKKLYSEPILSDEAETISVKALSDAFERVKQLSGNSL